MNREPINSHMLGLCQTFEECFSPRDVTRVWGGGVGFFRNVISLYIFSIQLVHSRSPSTARFESFRPLSLYYRKNKMRFPPWDNKISPPSRANLSIANSSPSKRVVDVKSKVCTPKCATCFRWSSSGVGWKCFGSQLVSKWKGNRLEVVSEFLEMA
jgi:hypothetical protein